MQIPEQSLKLSRVPQDFQWKEMEGQKKPSLLYPFPSIPFTLKTLTNPHLCPFSLCSPLSHPSHFSIFNSFNQDPTVVQVGAETAPSKPKLISYFSRNSISILQNSSVLEHRKVMKKYSSANSSHANSLLEETLQWTWTSGRPPVTLSVYEPCKGDLFPVIEWGLYFY